MYCFNHKPFYLMNCMKKNFHGECIFYQLSGNSDNGDNTDMLGHMGIYIFFFIIYHLPKEYFFYLVEQQSEICQFWNCKFIRHSVLPWQISTGSDLNWMKKVTVSKTNLRSTSHFIYTSYHKYFLLSVVSDE